MTASPATAAERFRDRNITFANGSVGQNIDIPSANPRNYYQAISRPAEMAPVTIDGKLFLPPGASGKGPLPLVIVVPGSLGVAPSHVGARRDVHRHRHRRLRARSLRGARHRLHGRQPDAVFVRRQRLRRAGRLEGTERAAARSMPARIGAQGHSRGGSAVLTAATRRFADPAIGAGTRAASRARRLSLERPPVPRPERGHHRGARSDGRSRRVVLADAGAGPRAGDPAGRRPRPRCGSSPAPRTASIAARRAAHRGRLRLARRAHHLSRRRRRLHPSARGHARPELVDRDLMVYGLKAGYGGKGATSAAATTRRAVPRRHARVLAADPARVSFQPFVGHSNAVLSSSKHNWRMPHALRQAQGWVECAAGAPC